MDQGGTEVCIVSLVGPGIQAIPNSNQAGEVARHANDHLAEIIAKSPKRLKGFAALALQDPNAAAQELTRKWDTSQPHCPHPLWRNANGRGG
jgi:2,3-dihydroxybenzoate decarboxylase